MRAVTVAAIQPPEPRTEYGIATEAMIERGLAWVAEAARQGADVALLPEYFNVFGLEKDALHAAAERISDLCRRVAERTRANNMHVILPLVVKCGGRYFNRALILDPRGVEIGHYDKVHLTITERDDYDLAAGGALPVFKTAFCMVGVMTCYDVYFPEVSRILGLKGAEIIFFPTLQRSEQEEVCLLQARMRAMDSFAYIVRSSYGRPAGAKAVAGAMRGGSYIVRPDGVVIADAGAEEGMTIARIDLDNPWRRPRCHGAPPAVVRDFIMEDRRPELYARLVEGELPDAK
ncbi:MAG: carbon-nitrogen hydrolase family protein [Planctomycetes bacterium]|nr:carbon-nitrogen hydrolase family protein [Planctomycetota bacterium]